MLQLKLSDLVARSVRANESGSSSTGENPEARSLYVEFRASEGHFTSSFNNLAVKMHYMVR